MVSFLPDVEITGRFHISNPLYTYGLQRVPNQQRYDEMDAVFYSSAFATQGVALEPATHCLMLQPVPLQSNTNLAFFQFSPTDPDADNDTSGKWREVLDASSGLTVMEMPDATPGRAFSAVSLFDIPQDSGFYLDIYRGDAAREAVRSPADFYTQVLIAQGVLGGLRLSCGYGAPPILECCLGFDDSGNPTWVEVARSRDIPDCEAYLASRGDRTLRLRILPLPSEGAIIIDIGQGDDALVFRLNGLYLPGGPLAVVGRGGVARVQYRPMRFTPLGAVISAIKEHGVAIVNEPIVQVDSVLDDMATCTFEGEIVNGTQSRYALTLDATASIDPDEESGLARETPLVRSVSILFPGVTYNSWVYHEVEANVRRVENEMLQFDLAGLSYSQRATVVCDNWHNDWTQASGYRAGFLEAGINGDNWRRITGWVSGMRFVDSGTTREAYFTLEGKEHWLKRRAMGECGPFDGWDVYAVIRFLAGKGGVTDYFLQALPYTLPGRGAPSPYYHLPVGTGSQGALFQFDPRTSCWDAMCQIARKVRGYLGFDVFGFLRFYKWKAEYLGTWMQAFDVVPGTFDGVPLYNQLKRQLSVAVDLSDVRSDVVVGSIDPYTWLPIFAHGHNEDVVIDMTSPAFLGNEDAFVQIDPLLFDASMQDEVVEDVLYQASLPGLSVQMEGYYQHRVVPLNVVTVAEGNALGGLYPFYVTGMNSSYGVNRQAFFGASNLTGRWLLNG